MGTRTCGLAVKTYILVRVLVRLGLDKCRAGILVRLKVMFSVRLGYVPAACNMCIQLTHKYENSPNILKERLFSQMLRFTYEQ